MSGVSLDCLMGVILSDNVRCLRPEQDGVGHESDSIRQASGASDTAITCPMQGKVGHCQTFFAHQTCPTVSAWTFFEHFRTKTRIRHSRTNIGHGATSDT